MNPSKLNGGFWLMSEQRKALDALREELRERIEANERRFDDPYYRIEGVFQPADADWPGDKEGRALLAYVSHYRIFGRVIPCVEEMLRELPKHTNAHFYFGPPAGKRIHEQQLSGHSWLLRGLCEHYEQFKDAFSLAALRSVTEHLYLPLLGRFSTYPVDREKIDRGGVSGANVGVVGDWLLSSDTGCAFMSIDGLSHVYALTDDARVLQLLTEMTARFRTMDKAGMRLQTHCTLTAARGMLRLYEKTGDAQFLHDAKDIFTLYTRGGGMSRTYQNLNWWGRPDTWTEPCAIVDSLMLAGELFRLTGSDTYRRFAARIFANGFASAQRENGGAGTDSIVLPGQPYLYLKMEEAFFCCTMRLAEGLRYAWDHAEMIVPETTGKLKRDAEGRYHDGDLLYAEIQEAGNADVASYLPEAVTVDGHRLVPLVKYYRLPMAIARELRQRVLFD